MIKILSPAPAKPYTSKFHPPQLRGTGMSMVDMYGPDGYENPRGQLSSVGRSLTATFKSRCFGQRHLLGEFLFRNNMVQKVRVEPLKGKGIALDAQVASYDPTRPSATEKFYIATITVAPFSETEMCEVISNVKKSAIWTHLAKYPPCMRGLGVPLLERQQLARVPRQVVEQMAYHWETNVGRYVLKASCDCNDHTRGGWCKHVAALSFELVLWSEVRPLWLLLALGMLCNEMTRTGGGTAGIGVEGATPGDRREGLGFTGRAVKKLVIALSATFCFFGGAPKRSGVSLARKAFLT